MPDSVRKRAEALYFEVMDLTGEAQSVALERACGSDLALREDLVARGVEQAKKFTWRACAEKVLGVLEQV